MKNIDIIQRFLFENLNVRGEIVRLCTSYKTISDQHTYPVAVQNLLGQALVTSVLLSAIIKVNGRLTVQFNGQPPLKLLMAQCNQNFEIRGLAQWSGDSVNEADLLDALKKGTLGIIIRPEQMTNAYQGIVNWNGHSLAESIEGYFRNSEQLPTRLWLAVEGNNAVGLLLQAIPSAGLKKNKPVIENEDFQHIVHLTDTITQEELLTLSNETILHRLYSQEKVLVFQPVDVKFGCTCSQERSENAVLMLGESEAKQELEQNKKVMVKCEFCNKEYVFDQVDVGNIFKKGDKPATLH